MISNISEITTKQSLTNIDAPNIKNFNSAVEQSEKNTYLAVGPAALAIPFFKAVAGSSAAVTLPAAAALTGTVLLLNKGCDVEEVTGEGGSAKPTTEPAKEYTKPTQQEERDDYLAGKKAGKEDARQAGNVSNSLPRDSGNPWIDGYIEGNEKLGNIYDEEQRGIKNKDKEKTKK